MPEAYDLPKGELMRGKRGFVMGVANHQSIAWGIASQLAAQGAELAFGYMEMNEKRVKPLGESIGVKSYATFDASQPGSIPAAFDKVGADFGGRLDFMLHAIGFAERSQIAGSFLDNAERGAFLRAMDVSVYSWVEAAQCAARMMDRGGSMVTMTYLGSERAIPNYNTMGVCKAALEASTRYIARDLGPRGIRVNAISAGAVRTLSLAGIQGGRQMLSRGRQLSALQEDTSMEGVAGCALWLLSDLGRSTTGEVVHVDAGFHMMGLPSEEEAEAKAGGLGRVGPHEAAGGLAGDALDVLDRQVGRQAEQALQLVPAQHHAGEEVRRLVRIGRVDPARAGLPRQEGRQLGAAAAEPARQHAAHQRRVMRRSLDQEAQEGDAAAEAGGPQQRLAVGGEGFLREGLGALDVERAGDRLTAALDQRPHQIDLRAVVIVDRLLGNAGAAGDLVERGGEAALEDHVRRGLEDGLVLDAIDLAGESGHGRASYAGRRPKDCAGSTDCAEPGRRPPGRSCAGRRPPA